MRCFKRPILDCFAFTSFNNRLPAAVIVAKNVKFAQFIPVLNSNSAGNHAKAGLIGLLVLGLSGIAMVYF